MSLGSHKQFLRHVLLVVLKSAVVLAGVAQGTCTPPPIEKLLVHADQVAETSNKVLPEYEYILVRSGLFETAHSEHEPSEVYLGYAVNGVRVQRLYLENGTTLTPEKQKQTEKDVARLLKKTPRAASSKASSRDSSLSLLRVGSFSNPRCRTIDGRKSFVFDYKGNPQAHTNSMEEKAGRHFQGVMIFDAEDGAATAQDMKLASDIRLALVFKLKKGLTISTHSVRVAPGIWHTSQERFAGGVRMYFNGASATVEDHYLQYRRVGQRDHDPYLGVAYGQLPAEIRESMVNALDAAQREPLPDEAE